MHIQGIRSFHPWQQCKDIRNLNAHVGEWLKARTKFASQMPPEHVREYFVAILPDELRNEVQRRRRDLPRLDDVITFVQDEITRHNDKRISEFHSISEQKILGGKHEPSPALSHRMLASSSRGRSTALSMWFGSNLVDGLRGEHFQDQNRLPAGLHLQDSKAVTTAGTLIMSANTILTTRPC